FTCLITLTIGIGRRGVADIKRLASKLLAGKLAIEGGRITGRFRIELARLARSAGFRRTADPVPCARNGDRPIRDVEDLAEMRLRGLRILQATQSIPAGMEFRLDDIGRRTCGMIGNNPIGCLELSLIDKPAAD